MGEGGVWGLGKIFGFYSRGWGRGGRGEHNTPIFIIWENSKYTYFRVIIFNIGKLIFKKEIWQQ